jgi:hypothetical protein
MMANDAVQIKLTLENEKLTKQLRDTERKFQRLEANAKKSTKGISDAFTAAFSSIAVPAAVFASVSALTDKLIQTAKAVGDLNDKAVSLGVSFKNFQVLQFAAIQSGVGVDKLTQSMGKLQATLGQVAEGEGGKAADVIKKLGLNIEQLINLEPDEQFATIAQELAKIPNPSERAAAGVALFGKGFRELNPLINDSKEGLAGWADEAEKAGVIIDDLTRDKMARFDDSIETINLQLQASRAKFLAPFAEFLSTTFSYALDDSIGRFEKLITLQSQLSLGGLTRQVIELGRQTSAASDAVTGSQGPRTRGGRRGAAPVAAEIEAEVPKIKEASAKAGRVAGKARATAEVDTYKQTLTDAQKSLADAQAKLFGFESGGLGGLEAVEQQIKLRERIASLVGDETSPERIKALTDIAQAEFDIAQALEEQIEVRERNAKATQDANAQMEQNALEMKAAWESTANVISNVFAGIITGASSAKDAVLGLIEAILQAIAQAAILAAFGQGTFRGNLGFSGGSGGTARSGPPGPSVRVYNYGQAAGGVVTRTGSDGSVDIMIGQIAKAISSGGNQLDNTLRRTYGIKRIGV